MFEAWYAAMVPALSRLFRDLRSPQPELDSRTVMAVMAGLEPVWDRYPAFPTGQLTQRRCGKRSPFSKARWARPRVHGAGSVHGRWC